MSQHEKIILLRILLMISQASVFDPTFTCANLQSQVIDRTLEVATLPARPSILASGSSQSEYDVVVRKREHFASALHTFADHTSRLGDDFAGLFHRTPARRLVMKHRIWPLLEDFWLQSDPIDNIADDSLIPIE